MENQFFQKTGNMEAVQEGSLSKTFMANVFTYMFTALAITGVIAYWFASSDGLLQLLYRPEGGHTILGWVIMLSPLGLVFLMASAFRKLSAMALLGVFLAYSVLMGMSLSYIFLIYSLGAIYKTFAITSITFGIMAALGYTTKTDLTRFGGILMMAVIGLIVASVVNIFIASSSFDWLISILGVLIFTGLTAYDVQKLKRIGAGIEYGTQEASKLAIMGALSLYLDFINLFLFMLRLFGGNRD